MIAIIAPEPVSWLTSIIDAASVHGPVRVLAPWAMPGWSVRVMRRLPPRLRQFAERRMVAGQAALSTIPGWQAGEAVLRAWATGHADRDLRGRFAVRHAVDVLAAGWLERVKPRAVIAPSCAAQRTFAVARRVGAVALLLEDLPAIRQLHGDLDDAQAAHPGCVFLRRYRAPDRVLVRQEVERVLASYLIVRSHHARRVREQAGFVPTSIIDFAEPWLVQGAPAPGPPMPVPEPVPADRPVRVLLAGLAAARHGTVEALAAVAARPHITLLVRTGEGSEPAGLLDHPRVVQATPAEREHLEGVDLVIAPAWCESNLREVALAAKKGIPVVATARGAGYIEPWHEIAPGHAHELGLAIDRVLAMPRPARPRQGLVPLAEALGQVLD